MDKISLSKNQEIREIRLELADNGGVVLNYTIYTPSLKNRDSNWDNKTEVYQEDEIESAALPRIMELYKMDLANRSKSKPAKTSSTPIKAKA